MYVAFHIMYYIKANLFHNISYTLQFLFEFMHHEIVYAEIAGSEQNNLKNAITHLYIYF